MWSRREELQRLVEVLTEAPADSLTSPMKMALAVLLSLVGEETLVRRTYVRTSSKLPTVYVR